MYTSRFAVVLLLASLLAGPAQGEGFNNFMAGLNGVITAPADPVMAVIEPPEDFEGLPAAAYTGRFLGFFVGVVQMIHRMGMGVVDIALTPLWVMPTLSPEGRWDIWQPGYEIEYDY